MTFLSIRSCLITAMILGASSALGQTQGVSVQAGAGGGVNDGVLIGTHGFFYSDNSSLGADDLVNGSSLFMRFDAQVNEQDYFSGLGLFYEIDSFGGIQKDTAMGLTLELLAGNFYLKFMPGFIEQNYKERSFSKRSGSFFATEFGIRGALLFGKTFYELAVQRRSITIDQEDGRQMTDKIERTEMFPVFGGGLTL